MQRQASNPRHNSKQGVKLPPIPEKIYFTIGEAGRLCKLKPHVLRYWEQEFIELCPDKRRGNRRYYQREEILLIRKIRHLLYEEGYTIEGARAQLQGKNTKAHDNQINKLLKETIDELESIAEELL